MYSLNLKLPMIILHFHKNSPHSNFIQTSFEQKKTTLYVSFIQAPHGSHLPKWIFQSLHINFFFIGNRDFIEKKVTSCSRWWTLCTWNNYNKSNRKISRF